MSRGAKAVALKLGGGKTAVTYWLAFDIDKLVMLEEVLDLDFEAIREQLGQNKRLGFTRAVLWAGLQEHQPTLDLRAAGELLASEGAEEIGTAIFAAMRKAFPDASDVAEDGAPGVPPQAPEA